MRCTFYDNLHVKGKSEQVPAWRLQEMRRRARNSNPDLPGMLPSATRADLTPTSAARAELTPSPSSPSSTMKANRKCSMLDGDGAFGSDKDFAYLDQFELVGREDELSVITGGAQGLTLVHFSSST